MARRWRSPLVARAAPAPGRPPALFLAAPLLLAALLPHPATGLQDGAIAGTVVDLHSQEPVVDAVVRLQATEATTVTDQDGRFRFPAVEPGEHVLEVRHLAYEDGGGAVAVEGTAGETTVEILLVPALIPLDPIATDAAAPREPPPGARLESVYERRNYMERAGQGTFIDEEDLAIYGQGGRISSVIQGMIPGTSVTRRERVIFRRAGQSCQPLWYLDGNQVSHQDARGIPTGDVELIEVYRGLAELPAAFDYTSCGIIAIWTKRTEEGEPFTWGRFLGLTGFAAIVYGVNQLIR